ncbi:hypothetical protein A1Q1_02182 [Trichosporon asahii var. asahii CBS 2479]|uniref:Uncharacterized protein n=1 Tax=Trichosporon asahii var. asahii (strain ATCC 90039 / CBS 2479 / JCM 2466 / KCTC 7840 / NBRC 103889/ NCYC 2677 / UAMH 7654) TaxID=1186058 RepID=J6F109_TRIAS|nr:hypothetical protein A1Q1_02182 [Trichosporon asahii var. asahii CBS 2479]EJT48847.1 hypothetical protein A1Q1_02182 [Trichosporon asahii var. asahii CBS 2479]
MSVVSEATTEDDGAFHPRFATGGDITLTAIDNTKFRFTLSTLRKLPSFQVELMSVSYSAPSSALHDMIDLPGAVPGPDQILPLTHARGPTLAFLLDCINEAEKRKADGVLPPGNAPASATATGEEDEDGDDDEEDDGDDTSDAEDENSPADAAFAAAMGMVLPALQPRKKGPAQTAPSYSGLPSGRHPRPRAKAAIFARAPILPRLPATGQAIERSKILLPTQPPDEDEWGPSGSVSPPPGEVADDSLQGGVGGEAFGLSGGGDVAVETSDDGGGEGGDSPGQDAKSGKEGDSNKTDTPRASSPAPSDAPSTASFAASVSAVSVKSVNSTKSAKSVNVPESVAASEAGSEATVTPTPQPELHAPTFEEVHNVLDAFDLSSLKYVVFDALKASCETHRSDTEAPAHALSVEYIYAFACLYSIGNKSYWATRCLASAWRAGLVPNATPLDRPRVRFASLDQYPLTLLAEDDLQALKDMFGRFNRAFSMFASHFVGTPPSDRNPRFGRACRQCPVKTEYDEWPKFKSALLREHLAPILIMNPQFIRKRNWLTDQLRQYITCPRCADRIIHLVLNLWKRVKSNDWSFNIRNRGRKPRFVHKRKLYHAWSHMSAAQQQAVQAHLQAQLQAHQAQQQAQPQQQPQQAQQQAANLSLTFANPGVTTTTTATGTGFTTVWQLPATAPGGPVSFQAWTAAPPSFVPNATAGQGTNTTAPASAANHVAPAPAPIPAPVAPTTQHVAPPAPAAPIAPPAASAGNTSPAHTGWGAPPPPPASASAPPASHSSSSGWVSAASSAWATSGSTGWGSSAPSPGFGSGGTSSGWGSGAGTSSGWGSGAGTSSGWASSPASGWGAGPSAATPAHASGWGAPPQSGTNNTQSSSSSHTAMNDAQGWGGPPPANDDGW